MAIEMTRLTYLLDSFQAAIDNEMACINGAKASRQKQAELRKQLVDLIGEETLSALLAGKEAANV
jgi:hypothetical protein